ncbi:hypothetical protein K505DRAFT_322222 [Melanomma pulvis-pyrius CBS 109.77]|uniref:Uncharacterized protein n=1 Tax=Melanomma pulvis-pyrius CBS 109.77 TaxID=1314802 RepID=A0A6A6XPP8_9PLEO|nr:hypothetical protein K505DRAFT_322222 [Melanomma pulvis-pyrius CBS 109.77]
MLVGTDADGLLALLTAYLPVCLLACLIARPLAPCARAVCLASAWKGLPVLSTLSTAIFPFPALLSASLRFAS